MPRLMVRSSAARRRAFRGFFTKSSLWPRDWFELRAEGLRRKVRLRGERRELLARRRNPMGRGRPCSRARRDTLRSSRRPAACGCGRFRGSSSSSKCDRRHVSAGERDQRAAAAVEQIAHGAEAERSRVVDVERHRLRAAQLVADVLRCEQSCRRRSRSRRLRTASRSTMPSGTSARRTWPKASRPRCSTASRRRRPKCVRRCLRRRRRRRARARRSGA